MFVEINIAWVFNLGGEFMWHFSNFDTQHPYKHCFEPPISYSQCYHFLAISNCLLFVTIATRSYGSIFGLSSYYYYYHHHYHYHGFKSAWALCIQICLGNSQRSPFAAIDGGKVAAAVVSEHTTL